MYVCMHVVCKSAIYIYIYIHAYIHTYTPTCIHIYIYIYIEREREREREREGGRQRETERERGIYMCIYIYVYIYIYIYMRCTCVPLGIIHIMHTHQISTNACTYIHHKHMCIYISKNTTNIRILSSQEIISDVATGCTFNIYIPAFLHAMIQHGPQQETSTTATTAATAPMTSITNPTTLSTDEPHAPGRESSSRLSRQTSFNNDDDPDPGVLNRASSSESRDNNNNKSQAAHRKDEKLVSRPGDKKKGLQVKEQREELRLDNEADSSSRHASDRSDVHAGEYSRSLSRSSKKVVSIGTHMYIRAMYTCMHACIRIHIYVSYTHTYVIYIYIHINYVHYTDIHINYVHYTDIHTYMHTYIHTSTHTHIQVFSAGDNSIDNMRSFDVMSKTFDMHSKNQSQLSWRGSSHAGVCMCVCVYIYIYNVHT
jgi:hypothetical protein